MCSLKLVQAGVCVHLCRPRVANLEKREDSQGAGWLLGLKGHLAVLSQSFSHIKIPIKSNTFKFCQNVNIINIIALSSIRQVPAN